MILVTGGAGFIGSNIVAALDDIGEEVSVCDRLRSNDKWRNLAKRSLRAFISPGSLPEFLDRSPPSSIDVIVHMGAISSTTENDGDLVIQNNFELSRYLWEWCSEHNTRFIYASSAATYGDGSNGFLDDWTDAGLQKLRPLNLYGWSKQLFDRYVAQSIEHRKCAPPQFAGLKFFNVYGPNEYHKGSMKSVVAHLFPRISSGSPAELFRSYHPDYSHGGQLRDFVYVRDCVEAVLWLLNNPSVSGIFNIGSGQARTFSDLARATMRAAGRTPEIKFIDMPISLRSKYQYYTQADISGLRKHGYTRVPTPLEEGVEDYVTGYLMNEIDIYR
jgi:ADP-L-glycero-D-manno-heptose 6-epimerase